MISGIIIGLLIAIFNAILFFIFRNPVNRVAKNIESSLNTVAVKGKAQIISIEDPIEHVKELMKK